MRRQGVIRFEMPEDTLPLDHSARLIWRVLGTLDVSAFTATAKAVDGRAGRDVLSPTMMLTLWLYAISVGIGSAREIARRTKSDEAFRWIVGDQEVGHAALSAFRVGHWTALEKLMDSDPSGRTVDADLWDLKATGTSGALAFTVHDSDARPVANANVTVNLLRDGFHAVGTLEARTDQAGNADILLPETLADNVWALVEAAADYPRAEAIVELTGSR